MNNIFNFHPAGAKAFHSENIKVELFEEMGRIIIKDYNHNVACQVDGKINISRGISEASVG